MTIITSLAMMSMYIWYYCHFPKKSTAESGEHRMALKSRLVSMIYTKALKWSGGLIFYPIDLTIDMHANGDIWNSFNY